ncbi:PREDICTED: uncharacterized protein LOC109211862 [Nicotiana attenuata]|uniref:uncharacterized protein LOC109211862 n=1 Tax=Nicotiana attenuata TaxID=49451 RepID=UPI000904E3ED|nr:PREDICTED: uncharacterized protein LOC109211862 [Nicotiana attenuata]
MNKPHGSIDKPRGGAADKWTDDETSILINVLHDDARKHGFNGSTLSGPRWTEIKDEFLMKIGNVDRFDYEKIKSKVGRLNRETKTFKELLNSCSGYGWDPIANTQKKEKNVYISKYRYQGLKDFDLLDEIFGNSFATGNHVTYSTNPNFSQQSNEAIAVENEPSNCDDYPAGTENLCRLMSLNTGSETVSGKRTKHLEWKRNKEEAKERKKQEQEQIQALKETEIDVYSEEAVTTHLQFVLQKHGLANEKFSPAAPFLLNPSFRKIFVHMTEKNQVEWFNDLKKN